VQLTEAGRALFERSRAILNELEDAKRSLANLSGEIRGALSLATSHHIGLHRIPITLKRFRARYPQVRLDLRFMDSEQACHAVVRGEIELAVVTLRPRRSRSSVANACGTIPSTSSWRRITRSRRIRARRCTS